MKNLDIWSEKSSWRPQRTFARALVKQPLGNASPSLIRGNEELPLTQTVREIGLKYGIDFSGYSVGLFYDQRLNRKTLIKEIPHKVLNCFAYTCAFSVAAASIGSQTFSIDLSARALAQGKKNFQLNGMSLSGHQFVVDDVFSVLKRLVKRQEKYDCIILDPPTFSRSNKGSFQVERDFSQLLRMALGCATSRAHILLSTNCSSLEVSDLQAIASHVAYSLGISFQYYSSEEPCDLLGGPSSKTVWLKIK